MPRWEHMCYLAAKRAILTNWIQPRAPTIEELKVSMKKLFLVERLDAELTSTKQMRLFAKTWQAYLAINYTTQEKEKMMQYPMYGRQRTMGSHGHVELGDLKGATVDKIAALNRGRQRPRYRDGNRL